MAVTCWLGPGAVALGRLVDVDGCPLLLLLFAAAVCTGTTLVRVLRSSAPSCKRSYVLTSTYQCTVHRTFTVYTVIHNSTYYECEMYYRSCVC